MTEFPKAVFPSNKQLVAVLATLKEQGLTFQDCIDAFGVTEANPYVAAAKQAKAPESLHIGDKAVVLSDDDEGAYVQVWVYVPAEKAILSHSAVLETVLESAKLGIQGMALQGDARYSARYELYACQAEWLEDLLMNYGEELDDIATESLVGRVPKSITWVSKAGKSFNFMPSAAISELRLLARIIGLPDYVSDAAEKFVYRYGNKLDAILTAYQVSPD